MAAAAAAAASRSPAKVLGLPDGGDREENLRIVRLKVIAGISLAKKDLLGASDPYVKVTVYDSADGILTSVQTKTVKKTLNPKWNEEFLFRVNPQKHRFLFEVFDENRLTRDDFLGQVDVPLCQLSTENPTTERPYTFKDFVLHPRSPKSRVKGHLRLKMTYIPKSNGSEDDGTEQAEELEPGWIILDQLEVPCQLQEASLPAGWEERQDVLGRTYYVHHETRRTQWKRPAAQDNRPNAESSNLQLEVEHAFASRHQITEEAENLDSRESPESWEIITEDEATMYSNQSPQAARQQGSSGAEACLAEELNAQLTTSERPAAGQAASSCTVRVPLEATAPFQPLALPWAPLRACSPVFPIPMGGLFKKLYRSLALPHSALCKQWILTLSSHILCLRTCTAHKCWVRSVFLFHTEIQLLPEDDKLVCRHYSCENCNKMKNH